MAKIALLIGVSEYEPGLNPLPAAVKDLDAMKEVLMHPEMGGFSSSDIVLLKNPERQAMEESIEMLFANRHRNDLVLLFFSGHGIKDDSGRLYLTTSKTRKTPQGDLVRSSSVSARFIHESMGRSRSKRKVVILDSCFSGAFAEGLSAKDDGTVDIQAQLGGEGCAILTSSSSTQYSFEQEGEELSLYTRFLTEGIKTGAADLDEDDFISINELHEYASRKVREVKPELKPELYAIREGFKIRLSKVPQGDPLQRYRKEVIRLGKRGELTIVGRSILENFRLKLGLSVDEAKAVENEVLEPYRRDFQQKLQRYGQTVTDVLHRDGSIDENTRQELQQLQHVLELRKEDTVPLEAKIAKQLETYNQNLQKYKEVFAEAVRQEYPLDEKWCKRLQQMKQQLSLSEVDVARIEAQTTAEVETYKRNLTQYEQAFLAATQQEYPLSDIRRDELRQYQSSLALSDVDITPVEAKITTQIETYQQKLKQYEEDFANITQRRYRLRDTERTQLKHTWQTLGLSEADVNSIETPILAEINTYQSNLRLYEHTFMDAVEQEYPLSEVKLSELWHYQQTLVLYAEDVASIETKIIASIENHLKNLKQYEQVFLDSIQFEFPVSEVTREELRQLQQVLELGDEEVEPLEEKLALQTEYSNHKSQQVDTTRSVAQTVEVGTQETENSETLKEYELKVSQFLQHGVSLKDRLIRKQLNSLRKTLGLSRDETEAVELRLTGGDQTQYSEALQEYEIEVSKYIQYGIPLEDHQVRNQLDTLRDTLELSRDETEAVELRLTGGPRPQIQYSEIQYSEALQEYEVEVSKYIQYGISLQDSQIRSQLNALRDTLGLSRDETEAVELELSRGTQTANIYSNSYTASRSVQRADQSLNPKRSLRWVASMLIGAVGVALASQFYYSMTELYQPMQPVSLSSPSSGSNEKINQAYLGIEFKTFITPELEIDLGSEPVVSRAKGVIVERVIPDSPAAQAGLQSGDVINAVNLRPISTADELKKLVGDSQIGSDFHLSLERDSQNLKITVQLGAFPSSNSLDPQ